MILLAQDSSININFVRFYIIFFDIILQFIFTLLGTLILFKQSFSDIVGMKETKQIGSLVSWLV